MISAGAKVLGSFTIGENSKIGAGSVVLEEVPPPIPRWWVFPAGGEKGETSRYPVIPWIR